MPVPLGEYGPDEYFAYVEDSEPLSTEITRPAKGEWWHPIVEARSWQDLHRPPTRLTWLDCVSARYFNELEWRDEICEIGNVEHAIRRRARILDLDQNHFVIASLFTGDGPREPVDPAQFAPGQWHRVTIDDTREGAPVLTSPDYDFDVRTLRRYLRFEADCTAAESSSLRNVFSLNFLRDGDIERGGGRFEPEPSPRAPQNSYAAQYARQNYLVS